MNRVPHQRRLFPIFEKVKKREKLSTDKKSLDKIVEIGSKIETSISEYFSRNNMDDPTKDFNWEYILIENKKIRMFVNSRSKFTFRKKWQTNL